MALTELQEAFLEDHRRLIRGLEEILDALQAADESGAAKAAARLDDEAGPHMEFEEEVFYPRLASIHGQGFVDRLIEEHEAGHTALELLISLEPGQELSPEQRETVEEGVRTALGHALGCGTLMSELGADDRVADPKDLERLRNYRKSGSRWTDRQYGGGRRAE